MIGDGCKVHSVFHSFSVVLILADQPPVFVSICRIFQDKVS
jgi:hypothetical protein